jgi:hypothetical protein
MAVTSADAASPEKTMPACSAKRRGTFWPDQANQDRNLLMKLARSGELRLCTRGTWRYRWESPTVHVGQLAKSGEVKSPAPSTHQAE